MKTNTPITSQQQWQQIYQDRIVAIGYDSDAAQVEIVNQFARIAAGLAQQQTTITSLKRSWWQKILGEDTKTDSVFVKGLYLHGSVGRGKTFLMDMFCEHIGVPVQRVHFHHFMKNVHDQLRTIKDQTDPLELIAADFAQQYRVLCLDEFMVSDITDAMLLYGLLKGLIDRGVVIITTTNIIPDDLYKNGLQRSRFLPAIALIKDKLVIHEMGAGQDFRRLCLDRHQRFFSPLNADNAAALETITEELSTNLVIERDGMITVNDRDIPFIAKSAEVIWFSFDTLCEGYRSQLDYLALAKEFNVFIVSDIPVLDTFKEDAAKRFLLLVDELYDRRIDLILSSALPIEEIYTGKKIAFEFDRLQSRLFEMQSQDYGKTT